MKRLRSACHDDDGYRKLIGRYLGRSRLSPSLTAVEILERVRGISPADLEAVCTAMKRAALRRLAAGDREAAAARDRRSRRGARPHPAFRAP